LETSISADQRVKEYKGDEYLVEAVEDVIENV